MSKLLYPVLHYICIFGTYSSQNIFYTFRLASIYLQEENLASSILSKYSYAFKILYELVGLFFT